MNPGRSIRLFLVDGSPSGLLTAEIMNEASHTLTGPGHQHDQGLSAVGKTEG